MITRPQHAASTATRTTWPLTRTASSSPKPRSAPATSETARSLRTSSRTSSTPPPALPLTTSQTLATSPWVRPPMAGLMSTATRLMDTGEFQDTLGENKIRSHCKTQPPNAPDGRFAIDQFDIDLTGDTVTCPAGQSTCACRKPCPPYATVEYGCRMPSSRSRRRMRTRSSSTGSGSARRARCGGCGVRCRTARTHPGRAAGGFGSRSGCRPTARFGSF